MGTDVPVLKSVSLPGVMRLKAKIENDEELVSFIGDPLSGQELKEFSGHLVRLLPGRISREVIRDSLLDMAGKAVTEDLIKHVAWRLAGNLRLLRTGRPAKPWTRQTVPEWMPLQFVEARPRRSAKGHFGANFVLRVLAGTACPELITKFYTAKFCRFVATKIGFSKPWGSYPFKDIREFVGLRVYGLFTPRSSLHRPNFEQVHAVPSMISNNRVLLRWRTRANGCGFTCFKGYKTPCWQCEVGYDQCAAGVHPRTYTLRDCVACQNNNWHDPRESRELCVECAIRRDTETETDFA